MSTTIHDINRQLRTYKKKYYVNKLVKGSIFFLGTLVCSFLLANFIEYIAEFSMLGRAILFYTLISIFTYTFIFWIIIPTVQLARLDKYLTDQDASIKIGQFYKNIDDKLTNYLQLSKDQIGTNLLLQESLNQRSKELSQYDFRNAVSYKQKKQHILLYLAAPLAVMLLILLVRPALISIPSTRILQYKKDVQKPSIFSFKYINKNQTFYRGESINIECQVESHKITPAQVFIHINGETRLLKKKKENYYTTKILNPQKELNIQFEVGASKSAIYHHKIFKRPQLKALTIDLKYPQYTSLPPHKIRNRGTLKIPEGTEIKWTVHSRHTTQVIFHFDSISQPATLINDAYIIKKIATKPLLYCIALKNTHGLNKDSIAYNIDIIKDQYPRIITEQFEDSLLYNYLMIAGTINDDYGLSGLKIFYKTSEETNYKTKPITILPRLKSQRFSVELSLAPYAKGTAINYFLAVSDNDGVNGSKTTRSRTRNYQIPNNSTLLKKITVQEEKSAYNFAQSATKSEKMANQINQLRESIKGKKKLNWQEKQDVKNSLEKHKKLDKNVLKLANQIHQEQTQKEKFHEPSDDLRKKMDQLDNLMQEVLDDDTNKLIEELKNLLDQSKNIDKIQDKLNDLENKDRQLEKEIDRTLQLYKQLKFEQQLELNIRKTEKLADKQEKLSEKTGKQKSNKDLAEEQENLNKEFKEIEEGIEKLNKINQDLTRPNQLEKFDQEQQEITKNQQLSKDEINKNNLTKAGEQQQNAANKMKAMANKMAQMKQGIAQQKAQEDLKNLQYLLSNLLYLTHTQEDLLNKFKKTQQSDPRFVKLSEKQIVLNQSSSVVEDSLYALASRVFQIEAFVTKELAKMVNYMKESDLAIKARKKNYAIAKQQYAMTSMNNLALLLDNVLSQIQQDMANIKPGEQMCNKPGSGSKPNLGQVQEQLNQMIKELKGGQKNGRKLSKEVAKIAAQQQYIRENLKQFQKENNNSEEIREQLNQLKQLMRETEKDLINKNISDQLVQRQQNIRTKLLEVEKASNQQKRNNKRESRSAKAIKPTYPPAFDQYIKAKKKQLEMIRIIPPQLTPYYKEEVNKYYRRIN